MKTKLSAAILTILVAFAPTSRAETESPTTKPAAETKAAVIEQALPVAALLRSVKEADTALFQRCWDKAKAEQLELTPESAKKILEQYQLRFSKAFGDYSLADFSFTFVGDAEVGTVSVKFKDKEVPPIKVMKSGNVWKLGEK